MTKQTGIKKSNSADSRQQTDSAGDQVEMELVSKLSEVSFYEWILIKTTKHFSFVTVIKNLNEKTSILQNIMFTW